MLICILFKIIELSGGSLVVKCCTEVFIGLGLVGSNPGGKGSSSRLIGSEDFGWLKEEFELSDIIVVGFTVSVILLRVCSLGDAINGMVSVELFNIVCIS